MDSAQYIQKIFNNVNYGNETFSIGADYKLLPYHKFWSDYTRRYMRPLQDEISHYYVSFKTNIRSMISENLNEFILLCHQHGICYYLQSKAFSYQPIVSPKDEPQVLTLEKLSAGFYLWLASVCIALLVFICEHVYFYFTSP